MHRHKCYCIHRIYDETKGVNLHAAIENELHKHVADISNLFKHGIQEGAPLFVSCLLEKMEKQFKDRSPNHRQLQSPIQELFGAEQQESATCKKCLETKTLDEPFTVAILSLLGDPKNTRDAIDKHLNSHIRIDCTKCKETTDFDINRFWSTLPKLLCIEFVRFGVNQKSTKQNYTATHFDCAVEPCPFIELPTQDGEMQKYKLVSLASHLGNSVLRGHYTATANVNGMLYEFNDSAVRSVQSMPSDANLLLYAQTDESDEPNTIGNIPVLPAMQYSDFDTDDFGVLPTTTPTAATTTSTAATKTVTFAKPRVPKPTVAKTKTKLTPYTHFKALPSHYFNIKKSLHSMCRTKELKAVLTRTVQQVSKIQKLAALHCH